MISQQPSIILVEPQLAENVGMAARAMMNCSLYDLRLVKPRENHLSDKAIAASSGAEKILQSAKIFNTTEEAIADLEQIYATTARHRDMIKPVENASYAAEQITQALNQEISCGILFGPERTGLHNDDVCLANAIIEIPLNPEHCSLNLSQAVLLVGYEWYKRQIKAPEMQFITNKTTLAKKEKVLQFLKYFEDKLDNCGNFRQSEKRDRMIINLRNIFTRNQLTLQELNTLYGIINYLDRHQPD